MKLNSTIAASYFGAIVTESSCASNSWFMRGIDAKKDVIIGYNDDGSIFSRPISVCQLLLTPLEEISDEDAAEVAKIMGYDMKEPLIVKSSRTPTEQGRYMVERVAEGRGVLWHSVCDYLRPRSYDCGHGAIPSLIVAGVAVKKTK